MSGRVVLSLAAAIAVVWLFTGTLPGEQPDHTKIEGWRAREAEATSYSEMQEYRDSIEVECRKGREATHFQRPRRWWKS